jgi:branched-chain amino acid transport system ATP-binding protein
MLLEVEKIYTAYGLSRVLFGISLNVDQGEVVAMLGRNGVGKTTTLRSIMGLTPPYAGSIKWMGKEITGVSPYQIARMGIGYVPEDRRIFSDLNVWENLDVAMRKSESSEYEWTMDRVFELFPVLGTMKNRRGGNLSGGEQQMLAIARTLMGNPKLFLLDEPSEGLAPVVVNQLAGQISRLKQEGMTILLCEQNVEFSLELSDKIYILEKGEVRFEGSVNDFMKEEETCRAFLTV